MTYYRKSLFVLFLVVAVLNTPDFAATYYASPTGVDSTTNGTFEQPWKTFLYAQGRLAAGDTLYLRGGTYFENSTVTITRKGTSLAPITIQSYPGEHAVISGALSYFATAPNFEWMLVDPNINLYRTSRTLSGDPIGAWLLNDDIRILEYQNAANMDSTYYGPLSGATNFYNGPGIMQRGSYLYIRLSPNPNDLTDSSGHTIAPVPSVYNPNQMPIAVWTHETLIQLNNAAYIHFKDITFAHAEYIIDPSNGTNNIEFDHCTIKHGYYGILTRTSTPALHDWNIHDCEFDGGMPEWVYWMDVKAETNPHEAYPVFEEQSLGNDEGAMVNFVIERNIFRRTFDGITVFSGSRNVVIRRNIIEYTTDDAMNFYKDVNNVEVAHNMLWSVAEGIAVLSGTGKATGPVYIHHNVIDNSHYRRGGRVGNEKGYAVWMVIDPFGSHDEADKYAWWRLYNNTIITRKCPPYSWNPVGPMTDFGNSNKYVYNNIFLSRDARIIFSGSSNDYIESFATGSHYDGDVLYQMITDASRPLFYHWGNTSNYTTLAAFRAANPTSSWEVNGLQIDPQFNFTQIDDPNFDPDPNTMWERYRPANAQVFTAGASYAGLNWPDTQYVNYRGAIPPQGANLNETGTVDFADFAIFAKHWLETDCFAPLYCEGADINKDSGINTQDLYEFASDWLNSN